MSEEQDDAVREGSGLRTVIMVIGALYVLGSLYVGYTLQNRLEKSLPMRSFNNSCRLF